MIREEAIRCLSVHSSTNGSGQCTDKQHYEAKQMAIKALEQEPCDDAISRQAAIDTIESWLSCDDYNEAECHIMCAMQSVLYDLPSVNPQEPKTGHCKDCKYFEYDSVAKVDGIPLILAHEICERWGNGCKTSEDGYCFLFEPQESEESEDKE